LDDANAFIGKERERPAQEMPIGDEVGIKDRNKVARAHLQAVVHIARLGMRIVGSRDVDCSPCLAIILKPATTLIIEDKDLYLMSWIVERERSDDGSFQDIERLVVGGDKYVDRWELVFITVEESLGEPI
jgi:hypothetical protein